MITKSLKYAVPSLCLIVGLFLGFSTFAISFNLSAAEANEKLLFVFAGIFIGSVGASYFLQGRSWVAIGLLAGPSLLAILLPVLTVAQTPEIYRNSAFQIAILLGCALSGPVISFVFRKIIRKKD